MKLITVFIYMITYLRKTLIIVPKLDTDIKNTFNNKLITINSCDFLF